MLRCPLWTSLTLAVGATLATATTATTPIQAQNDGPGSPPSAAACEALRDVRGPTITSARLRNNTSTGDPYCYVRGVLTGGTMS